MLKFNNDGTRRRRRREIFGSKTIAKGLRWWERVGINRGEFFNPFFSHPSVGCYYCRSLCAFPSNWWFLIKTSVNPFFSQQFIPCRVPIHARKPLEIETDRTYGGRLRCCEKPTLKPNISPMRTVINYNEIDSLIAPVGRLHANGKKK